MPIKDCQLNNLPGYKYGNSGKCYTYKNEEQRKLAHQKAIAQEVAAGGFDEPAVNQELTLIEKAKILFDKKNKKNK
jgi:hypothetical protein